MKILDSAFEFHNRKSLATFKITYYSIATLMAHSSVLIFAVTAELLALSYDAVKMVRKEHWTSGVTIKKLFCLTLLSHIDTVC
jgi:hypothetical protein